MSTKNYDQMMYGSWDMVCNGCNYFSFWAIFCTFSPVTAQKNEILKKWKKDLEILSFYICVPEIMIRWCTIPEIWCVTNVIVIFHFGPFFALLPSNSPKYQNFDKVKKNLGDIIILRMCAKNHDQMMYGFWDIVHDGCNYFLFWAILCPFTPATSQKN